MTCSKREAAKTTYPGTLIRIGASPGAPLILIPLSVSLEALAMSVPDLTEFDAIKGFPGLTDNQRRFLSAFAQAGNLTAAAELSGMTRQIHYVWLSSPEYRKAFETAKDIGVDIVQWEARRRAMDGSDRLLIFLLKAMKPEVYRDNYRPGPRAKIDHQAIRKPIEVLTDDELLKRLEAAAERIRQRRAVLERVDGSGQPLLH
jgi:hypothetical protein